MAQVFEGRVAGAKVIHGHGHSEKSQFVDDLGGFVDIAHHSGFGNFELEVGRIQFVLFQRVFNVAYKRIVGKLDGRDIDKSAEIIDELRFLGVTVTMDDFGAGYSSFKYLGHLNFDWIKIDRNFLLDATRHSRTKTLYDGMVAMAHEIGLKVVAEGIESQIEYNYVHRLGVDEMQGNLLSKPLDAEAMTATLLAKTGRQRQTG